MRHQRIPGGVAFLASHGALDGLCSLCSLAKSTLQQHCAWASYPVSGAKCSLQSSGSEGSRKDVFLGSLKAGAGACEPRSVWTIQCDQKDVQTEWQHEHFPSLWQPLIFVLLKYKDPSNTPKAMTHGLGCSISRADLEHCICFSPGNWECWDVWIVTSCGVCPVMSFLNTCRTTEDGGQVDTNLSAQRNPDVSSFQSTHLVALWTLS